MRLRISIKGRVRPSVRPSVGPSVATSVRLSRVIFERRKTSFPMFRWRRNLTWTKRQSRTIQKWHKKCRSVGLFVYRWRKWKEMNNKWRQGSRIFWTPRFLFSFCFLIWTLSAVCFFPLFSDFPLVCCLMPSRAKPYMATLTPLQKFTQW